MLGIESFADLPDDHREKLIWKTELSIMNVKSITCFHHKHVYLKCYATSNIMLHLITIKKLKKDIYSSDNFTGSLCEINLDTEKSLCSKGKFIVPGEKVQNANIN